MLHSGSHLQLRGVLRYLALALALVCGDWVSGAPRSLPNRRKRLTQRFRQQRSLAASFLPAIRYPNTEPS